MNINSNFIEGKDAKELNELCKDYSKLKTQYESIKADFDRVTKRIKELCTQKENETTDFFIKMKITADSTILDTKRIEQELPEIASEYRKTKKGSISIQEILKK